MKVADDPNLHAHIRVGAGGKRTTYSEGAHKGASADVLYAQGEALFRDLRYGGEPPSELVITDWAREPCEASWHRSRRTRGAHLIYFSLQRAIAFQTELQGKDYKECSEALWGFIARWRSPMSVTMNTPRSNISCFP